MTGGVRDGSGTRSGGQAAVELALVLPLVVAVLVGLVQVGLVVRDHVWVQHAAREGARAAAVEEGLAPVRRAVEAAAGLDPARLDVHVSGRLAAGSHVTVTVRYRSRTDLPVIGPLLPDPLLEGRAVMRVEG